MASWKDKETLDFDKEEFDIDSIDPAVFDNPVLLLEYLEKQELQKKASTVSNYPTNQKAHGPILANTNSVSTNHDTVSRSIYGYNLIRGEIRINQVEAEAVVFIISLHEKGYSYSQIEYILGNTKHRTIKGKKFYPAAIQAIVKNKKVYEGETGYPPILKSKQKNPQRLQRVSDDHIYTSADQQSYQKTNKDTNADAYWEAVTRLRNSIEQRKESRGQKGEMPDKKFYRNVDEFLEVIKSKGIQTKDNRWNDGCVWVRADEEIADLMSRIMIKGRGFRYSPKCKAFGGEPGWYY